MQYALGEYGNTVLPASEIKLMALEALKSPAPHSKEVEVFFTNTPHSGAKVETINVTFEPFDGNEDTVLIGRTPSGDLIAFLMNDTGRPSTFVTQRETSLQEHAS